MAPGGFLFPLSPALRHYAWGDPSFLPALLGLGGDSRPVAEAWYGAHPAAPAQIIAGSARRPLDTELDRQGRSLPYLLKLLAAAAPLSIQVHPNRAQARAGFAAEEAAGVPRDARERRYRDDNHKPELIVALTPFAALCGFRAPADARRALDDGAPELARVLPATADLRELVAAYFALPDARVRPALEALIARLEREPAPASSPADWALHAHRSVTDSGDPPDRGLLFVFLLELITLEPGAGLYLPAGVPHAYLQGAGVEVMASSDNVLRAGLTPKHVDPEELLRVVRFDARRPPVVEPYECVAGDGGPIERRYPTAACELDVRVVDLEPGQVLDCESGGLDTVLALPAHADTRVTVSDGQARVELTRGLACLVGDARYVVSSDGPARIVRCVGPSVRAVSSFRGRRPTELAFGTSGLRGKVSDITDLEAYVNTRGFLDFLIASGDAVPGGVVAIAGDLRPSTDRLLHAVARAATDSGFELSNQGRVPTPALLHFALERGWPSIMVTGSHIPFDRNGIKFARSTGEILKDDEAAILEGVARVRERQYARAAPSSPFDDDGALRDGGELPPAGDDAARAYAARYQTAFGPDALGGLRVAFFEHSAVGRDLVPDLLESLGAEVVRVGRSDVFVAIDTEALSPARRRELDALVDDARRRSGGPIDALVSTDGDSDRPLVVAVDADGAGHFIGGDVLGTLVAEALGADAAAVPVSSTDLIERHLEPRGVAVVRTRIGSPWVIAAMANLDGERVVGWEANGGFLTGSDIATEHGRLAALPTRDAVLPIVCALARARREGPLSALVDALPQRASRATLLDHVPPERSAALVRAFGGDDPALRARRLQRFFDQRHGFSSISRTDTTDGIRIYFDSGDIAHVRPSGNAPQLRLYAVADTAARADAIIAAAVDEPDGILRRLLDGAAAYDKADRIGHNLRATERLLAAGDGPALVGIVSGTAAARDHWQRVLERGRDALGGPTVVALHEDLPVNQAFGVLLMWQRLRSSFEPGRGALVAFVFGEGSRATPITEAEAGQKPAIASFVAVGDGDERRLLTTVEVALRAFAPVEAYLRRSGFDGVVVKWGDEVQVPTLDLSGTDERLANADVVRFVSMQAMTDDSAANKDWVGVAPDGRITAFVPRRPLAAMAPLAESGLLQRRGEQLWGGVNLGSIAVSRALLDALLDEFGDDVNDASARRGDRPDLDPQLFTALTVAAIDDADARAEAWRVARDQSAAIADLDRRLPDAVGRLRRALERLEANRGRPVELRVVDFGDQYWGDIGQHRAFFDGIAALNDRGPRGDVARAIAGIGHERDERGNLAVGRVRLGADVDVENSVLVDVDIDRGRIRDSVLIGTCAGRVDAQAAFDLESTAASLTLAPRSGSYKIVSPDAVAAGPGERVTTAFLGDDDGMLLRVDEDTDLRDRPRTYDAAILDNPVSFADAHRRALDAGPAAVDDERRSATNRVRRALGRDSR